MLQTAEAYTEPVCPVHLSPLTSRGKCRVCLSEAVKATQQIRMGELRRRNMELVTNTKIVIKRKHKAGRYDRLPQPTDDCKTCGGMGYKPKEGTCSSCDGRGVLRAV